VVMSSALASPGYARRMGKQIESIPNETMDALSHYSWPGNIRELQNLMERAALLSTGPSLRVPLGEILNDPAFSGGNALEQAEREQILRALRETNWVVGGARGAAAARASRGRHWHTRWISWGSLALHNKSDPTPGQAA